MYREGRESSLISFRNWTRKSLLFILLLCFAKTGHLSPGWSPKGTLRPSKILHRFVGFRKEATFVLDGGMPLKRVGNRFLWAFARKLPLSWMAMPLKKVVTWRDTPLTRGEQLTLMFNILFMRTVSAAGTAFREASFSWRRGHFLLSHYLFFVLFHSVCSHYTFIGNAVFWPGLSILQSSAFPFSLLVISCSSPSCSFVFLRVLVSALQSSLPTFLR